MLKWVLLVAGLIIATIFVVALIKFMLKSEKDSKQNASKDEVGKVEEYKPDEKHIDIHSATSSIPVTDMSNDIKKED